MLLDDEEAVAVTVGLRTATGGAIAGIEEASLRALAKLEQVLPSRLRRRVNTLQTYTVSVPRNDAGPTVDPAVLTTLAAVCRDREQLRFDYHDHAGTATLRTVEPYRLVNWGRRWYLLAWDVERRDWRTFRVDRMRPRTPTGPRFTPRDLPDDDVAAYVSRRVSAAAWRYRAQVTVHAPAEVVADRISPAAGTVERARRPHLRPAHRRGHGRDPRRLPGPARRGLRRHRAARTPHAPAPARRPLPPRDRLTTCPTSRSMFGDH